MSSAASPLTLTGLGAGDHELRVRAIDVAGNVDATPATHRWTIDATAPDTSIDSGPDPTTSSTTAEFNFSADEPASFECALDDGVYEACTSPAEYSGLAEGEHRFQVRASDKAGNTDPTPASYAWTIEPPPDVTAPDTSIDSGPDAITASTTAEFTFSADESASFECALDGGAYEPCSSPAEYSELAEGEHRFQVRASDKAGNTDPTPASYAWTIEPPPDVTAPDTSIDSGPDAITASTTAEFTFSADEPASFECALDGGAFEPCSSPAENRDLADGEHELRVRAIDVAGNVDATPAVHRWAIDRTPPETSIDTGPKPVTNSTSATFTFSANEAGATFECSLDGAEFSPCASGKTYADLAAGEHGFRVRAGDGVGNVDGSAASRTWTIDRVAPQTTIDSAPAATTTSTSGRFTFSAGEAGSTFECSLDGAAFIACESPKDYSNLSLAGHVFQVRATDAAGNTDATPAARAWTVQAPAACTAGTITAAANADSWVLESSPSSNYRNDSALKVDSNASKSARVLVRFALPPMPAGCQITGARLRLYAGSYKQQRTLAAFRLGAPWAEAGVTWANHPATAGPAATTPSGQGYREWQVAAHVQAMYTDGNHGFLIRDATETGNGVEQAFHSREKRDSPPQLVISFG